MTLPFADCQGLGGHWTLGTVQAGFDLIARKTLPGAFGDAAVEANRDLLPGSWEVQGGDQPTWDPVEAAFVCGTPPCSGFSLMNVSKGKNQRGADSPINSCMRDLVGYAARCTGTDAKRGPEVVSFESVQQAYTLGRDLMMSLRDSLSERTGEAYRLTHVKMSGSSVGAAQMRHRYFPVFHRVPFGVYRPEPRKVVTYADAIGDLNDLRETADPQPYAAVMPSDWVVENAIYSQDGQVDWHLPSRGEDDRAHQLLQDVDEWWERGESLRDALKRMPRPPKTLLDRYSYDRSNWRDLRGWQWPRRIDPSKPGYVLAGSGGASFVHWNLPRFLTVREATRLMGLPDAWTWPVDRADRANALIGKCCPVQSGRWLSENVRLSLEDPSLAHAEPADQLGTYEFLHDSTLDYRRWPVEVSQYEYRPRQKVKS